MQSKSENEHCDHLGCQGSEGRGKARYRMPNQPTQIAPMADPGKFHSRYSVKING